MKLLLGAALWGVALAAQNLQGVALLHLDNEQRQEPLARAEEAQARVEAMSWQTKGFYICCVLFIIVLCIYPCAGAKPPHLEPTSEEDVKKLRDKIATEKEKLEEDWNRIHEGIENEEAAKEAMLQEHPDEPMDYDKMMQTMFKSVSDSVSSKMAKEGAVRKIVEQRMQNFGGKAKSFMLSKFNDTASDLMQAVDREEELLLLEWNEAVEANFPPASVVIAGLLSPLMLTLSVLNHVSQGLCLYLPTMILCFVALYIDHGVPCPGIPGMLWWLYIHTFLSTVLFFAHTLQLIKIVCGRNALAAKAEQVGAKLKEIEGHEEQSLSDMRDMFVGRSVLVQQALLIEDDCRRSFAYTLVGILTIIWMGTFIWTVVIVIGWTFVPGVAAFHASAQATAGDAFCGTWMTVLIARLLSIGGLLFLIINALTVARWFLDTLTHSEQFEKKLLKQCKRFDDAAGGIPICQILGKALVLRGSTDTVYARMNVCTNQKISLERQKDELKGKVSAAQARFDAAEADCNSLNEKASRVRSLEGGDTGFGGIVAQLEHQDDSASWKNAGIQAIQDAEKRTADTTAKIQGGTPDLDKFVERITDMVNEIRDSKEFKEAAEASKKYAEETAKKAEMLARQAAEKAEELKQAAAQKAEELKRQAKETIESEEFQQGVKQMKETAQQAVDKGVEKAGEAAELARKKSSEAMEAGKKAAADASSSQGQ